MNYKQLGKNIEKQRIEAKLSQTELANAIGVSQQQIANWEKGGNFQIGTVERIANGLNLKAPLVLFRDVFEKENEIMYTLEERESGTIFEEFKTEKEAIDAMREQVVEDVADGTYQDGFYSIYKIDGENKELVYHDIELIYVKENKEMKKERIDDYPNQKEALRDLEDAIEEYLDSCERTGHFDDLENWRFFLNENKNILKRWRINHGYVKNIFFAASEERKKQ